MITTFWNSQALPPNGAGKQLLINSAAAETSILQQVVDMGTVYNRGDVAALELMVKTNGVAPGAGATLTPWYSFASDGGYSPVELAAAAASQALNLANLANSRQVFMLPLLWQSAQYFSFWFNHSVLAAGATLEIVARVNGKVRP